MAFTYCYKSDKIMDLEITKNETTIDFRKEANGLIIIDMATEDGMNFTTIYLDKNEVEKVIKQLKKYIE